MFTVPLQQKGRYFRRCSFRSMFFTFHSRCSFRSMAWTSFPFFSYVHRINELVTKHSCNLFIPTSLGNADLNAFRNHEIQFCFFQQGFNIVYCSATLVVWGMGVFTTGGGGVFCKCGAYNGSNPQFYLLFDPDFSTL